MTSITTPIYDGLMEEVEMFGRVSEDCEHGLSAWLCEGPMHYPPDNPWDF